MKNLSKIIILILTVCSIQVSAQEKLIDRVVATVGSGVILQSEVEAQYAQYLLNRGEPAPDIKCRFLQQLIITKLLAQQAAIDSVEVTESEVDDDLNSRMRGMIAQGGGQERVEAFLKRSILQYKEEMRPVVAEQLKAQKFQRSLIQKITITPLEVKKYFESLAENEVPNISTQVEIGEITIEPELTKDEKNVFKERAEKYRQQVLDGTDFGTVARFYSEDKESAKRGGELGFAPRTNYVKEFSAMAFKLKEGEISPVFETEYGFHFLQVLQRRGEDVNVRHVLILTQPTQASLDRAKTKLDSVLNLVKTGKMSFSAAASRYSDNKETKFTGGMVIDPRSENRSTIIAVENLEKEVFVAIDPIQPGEYTESYQYQDPRTGKIGYKFNYLKTRIPPHRASLEQDFATIQFYAQEDKTRRKMSEWFEKKTKTTFVQINEDFGSCDELKIFSKNNLEDVAVTAAQ
mgnify:CR=1 FL=1